MNEHIRLAVVGLGYWGPNLVRAAHDVEGAEVAWICDLDEKALDKIGRRFPAARRTTDLDQVLDDPSVDAVLIATPVSTHFPLASRALEAGKHVFVEKPLAASTVEASGLEALAKVKDLVLMPGHTFLYSPPVRAIRDLITSGELGDIYFISSSRVNLGLHQRDVSVAWDLGPHDFSILRYWLDETPTHVSAMRRSCIIPGTPDVAFINLSFASEAVAHVELSWLAPSKLRRTTVVGSRKMVVYDDMSNEPVRVFDTGVMIPDPSTFGEYKLSYRTGDIVSPHISGSEPLCVELTDFCDSIRQGSTPVSSAAFGVEVVKMIEAVDRSFASEGARVDVNVDVDIDSALRRLRPHGGLAQDLASAAVRPAAEVA
jgi:predicted dehydrogenase